MTNYENNNNWFNTDDVLKFIFNNKKVLSIVACVTFIVSAIVSFMIPPQFKSTVVLFPAASASISKAYLSTNGGSKETVMQYGEEEDAERILQVLASDQIRNRLIQKFKLFDHYKINRNSKHPLAEITEQFKSNFNFSRTKYMAVEIRVYDRDAQFAADMANYCSMLIDTIMNTMYRERAKQAFAIVENEYLAMAQQLNNIQDSMQQIGLKGIADYESQAEVFNAAYAKAIAEGNNKAARSIEEKLRVLQNYGPHFLSLQKLLEYENERFSLLKAKYAEARVDAQQNVPCKYIIDHAYKADRKTFPIRWIIVFISTFSALFMTISLLIIKNKISENNN